MNIRPQVCMCSIGYFIILNADFGCWVRNAERDYQAADVYNMENGVLLHGKISVTFTPILRTLVGKLYFTFDLCAGTVRTEAHGASNLNSTCMASDLNSSNIGSLTYPIWGR